MKYPLTRIWATLALLQLSVVSAQELPVVNWENHPVHALDLSPDRSLLAAAHTADGRVQLFNTSEGHPVSVGHVVVGVDPISVRFRSNEQLWVVNHISDSVSVIDVPNRRVIATLQTADEPADVVFAGDPQRAYVSCSQANEIYVFDPEDLGATPQIIEIEAEEPKALAVSADGRSVYAAIFESGNATTILGGGAAELDTISFPPNVTRQLNSPYAGANPPPNDGEAFDPPLSPGLPTPPMVGMIVRKHADGRWLDDNQGDWTSLVSGAFATQSGRMAGWDLPDRDIAVIDTQSGTVSYVRSLMNVGMAIAANPATGDIHLVGTDATNEVRFEPVINGRFLRVNLARVPDSGAAAVFDLNPHLDYATSTQPQDVRDRSLGDPRGLVWQADGQRGFVSGMGSNNVVALGANGERLEDVAPIDVGQGPTGLALAEAHSRLYVWNHFEASLSVVDTQSLSEVARVQAFNPLPEAVTEGRRHLYDTHETSGLGHVSCASCHVDARIDRLAWDLGAPNAEVKEFNQNCGTERGQPCENFHPMKGPMVTQTLQDIIGNEPFHWRGDRDGLEEFNEAFEGLLGDDAQLTEQEMQQFEDMLATIHFPPNPFRNFDNSLPTSIDLEGHYTTGRFSPAGQPLGTGDAANGLRLYTQEVIDDPFTCADCHTLPTGMGANGPVFATADGIFAGGQRVPDGPLGENHLSVISTDGSTNVSMKVPQLRNMYEKVGFELTQPDNLAGFGFSHDGAIDSLARFISEPAFDLLNSDQEVADLVAFMLAFSGSDMQQPNVDGTAPPPQSLDTHAAVGAQVTLSGSAIPERLNEMISEADNLRVDVVAHGGGSPPAGWSYDAAAAGFVPDNGGQHVELAALVATASPTSPLTFTVVPAGLGTRLGIDRDGDGISNAVEYDQGSKPFDATSTTFSPWTGLWYNEARPGHGVDVQVSGNSLVAIWYTYNDDQTPTWYLASGPLARNWQAELKRFEWLPDEGRAEGTVVGSLGFDFRGRGSADFHWALGERSGTEPFQRFVFAGGATVRNYTGAWFDSAEPGWGLTADSMGDTRVAIFYFYDAQNEPRWVLGNGPNAVMASIEMKSFAGFCPDCEHEATTNQAAGTLGFDFAGLREAALTANVNYPALADSTWERETQIVPLSNEPINLDQ